MGGRGGLERKILQECGEALTNKRNKSRATQKDMILQTNDGTYVTRKTDIPTWRAKNYSKTSIAHPVTQNIVLLNLN